MAMTEIADNIVSGKRHSNMMRLNQYLDPNCNPSFLITQSPWIKQI